MARVRVTRRRSGQSAFTVRIDHHVTPGLLIDIVAEGLAIAPESVPENPSREWLANAARDYLWSHGQGGDRGVGDEMHHDAEAKVRGAFPEMFR